ncbi:MAG: NAD(P)/FAD-dependent oxidoreductase [Patescibacteria group bacterium]
MPDKKVTIIGAGMGGSLLAIYLARRNFDVEIYESRESVENLPVVSYKSINQSLCVRGIRALQEVHLWDEVKKLCTREAGRIIHQKDGLLYQAYGERQGFAEWSINRNDLNKCLAEEMKKYPHITVTYNTRCVGIDFERRTLVLENQNTKSREAKKVDILIGADGIHSAVRTAMEEQGLVEVTLDVMDWGYKNINIPAPHEGALPFRKDAFHLWSKKSAAVFGIPNWRGFFTSTITLPLAGSDSFESIRTKEACAEFFKQHVPDLYPYLESYVEDFMRQPATPFTSLYTSKWHCRDFCLLMGDAAHAMTIFYGQGINAAFEDCRIFAECLDLYYPDLETVFQIFEARRKPDTDCLAEVCKARFIDLKDRYEAPWFVSRSNVEMLLENHFPTKFHSLYTLIVHTTMSYAGAYKRYRKERHFARSLGMDALVLGYTLTYVVKDFFRKMQKSENAS